MAVTYNKLWHLLLDRGMKKKELQEMAELTSHTMLKLRNDRDISLEAMLKICKLLGMQYGRYYGCNRIVIIYMEEIQ